MRNKAKKIDTNLMKDELQQCQQLKNELKMKMIDK